MGQLMRNPKVYRVDTLAEAVRDITQAIEDAKTEPYEVTQAGFKRRTKKKKGIVLQEWFVVSITEDYLLEEMGLENV